MGDTPQFDPNQPFTVVQPGQPANPNQGPAAPQTAPPSLPKHASGFDPNASFDVVQPPQDDRGSIHKLWDWANRGLISKESIVNAMESPEVRKWLQGEHDAARSNTVHIPGFGNIDMNEFTSGVLDSSAGVLSSFTSPTSIALLGGGAAANALGKAGTALRGAGAVKTAVAAEKAGQALATTAKGAGLAIGATQVPEIIKGQQKGETAADAMERRLNAAGWTMLAAGEEGKHSKLDIMHQPLSDLPQSVRADAARLRTAASHNIQVAGDIFQKSIGITDDFKQGIKAGANMLGKQKGPEFSKVLDNISEDLKAISNENKGKLDSPKKWSEAIDKHLYGNVEAPLQARSGIERNSTESVVPNFRQRLETRLDNFFADNPLKYGGSDEVQAVKDKIIKRLTAETDHGNGVKTARDPNLYEAESARQGLNNIARPAYNGEPVSDGMRAAAVDTAAFLREVIDESYRDKGVEGVQEARDAERDLIKVSDAMWDAQAAFEKQGQLPWFKQLYNNLKTTALVGGLTAHFFTNPIGAALGAGELWGKTYLDNYRDIGKNLERAQELAQREPGAQATVPDQNAAVTQRPQPPPPQPPSKPGAPPPPTPPTPPTRPAMNHKIAAALSSYFNEFKGKSQYGDLMQRFSNEFNEIFTKVKEARDNKHGLTPEQDDQWEQAKKVQNVINQQHALEDEQMEKQAKADQAKYEKDMRTWNAKYRVDTAQLAAEEKAKADTEKQARVDAIKADPRVAHGKFQFATEPATPINTDGHSHTPEQAAEHEHGHILTYNAEGLDPIVFMSESHPEVGEGGRAAVRADVTNAGEGMEGIEKRVVGALGGAAWDEVHNGIKLGRNSGARTDVQLARRLLREEGGLSGAALEKAFDALYERAKGHVSNPTAYALVKANAGLRENGLHPDHHMSPERLEAYNNLLKGVFGHGETPSTDGVSEGDADGGPEKGKPVGPGGSRSEQNGLSEEVRAEDARKSAGETEKPRKTDTARFGHRVTEKGGEVRLDDETGNRGMVKYTLSGDTAAITGTHVDQKLSGRGIGKQMYERAAAEAKARGAKTITSDLAGQDSYGSAQTWKSLMRDHPGQIEEFPNKPGSMGYRWNLEQPKTDTAQLHIPKPPTEGRTSGDPKIDAMVKEGGAIVGGKIPGFEYKDKETGEPRQYPDMVLITEPEGGSTAAVPVHEVTPDRIKSEMSRMNAEWRKFHPKTDTVQMADTMQPYHESKMPHSEPVKVTFPDGTSHVDAVRGLNRGHALWRAQDNWPGSKVESASQEDLDKAQKTDTVQLSDTQKKAVDNAKWETNPNSGYRRLVVKDDAGNLLGRIVHDNYRIRLSEVPEGQQNQGIGKALYERAFEDAKANGTQELMSDTSLSPDAHRVWESLKKQGKYKITSEPDKHVNQGKTGIFDDLHVQHTVHLGEPKTDTAQLADTHSADPKDFGVEDYLPEDGGEHGMWHATTALDKVNAEGLKSRKQTGGAGLGGGWNNQSPEKVSVTYSEGHAQMIADRMRLAAQAARGEVTPEHVLDTMSRDAGLDDETPHEIATALRAPEETHEDWDKFNEWVNENYAKDPYELVQELDDALPEIFSGAEHQTRVGLTASREQMAKVDPDQIGVVQVAARKGAKPQHIAEENELRFHPNDLQVHHE